MRRRLALVAALALLPPACTDDVDDPEAADCPAATAEPLRAWGDAGFSGVVTIATGGDVECRFGTGGNDADTTFDIGSVSKAFTAAAVLQLVGAGTIALDDRAGALVPGLGGPVADATVEQLLLHTSGLVGTHAEDDDPISHDEGVVVQRGTVDTTDHGDFALAAKYRFHDAPERSALPSLGLLPFVKLPVSEAPLGSGKTDAGAVLLASLDLPARLSLDLNASLAAIGQSRPSGYLLQAVLAAGLSHDVGDWLTLFTDVMYASREERDSRDGVLFDAGVIWRPARDVALDASVVTSLAGRGPDWQVRGGLSLRFGR